MDIKPGIETFCHKLDEWAAKKIEAEGGKNEKDSFEQSWRDVRMAIRKSCLLSRTIYGNEKPSQTKCPVHDGQWSGIHCGWPGSTWRDLRTGAITSQAVSPNLQDWYNKGCRCFMHTCSCTTGWNPDEHCGCGVKP